MCGNDNISNAGINNDKSIVLGIDIGGTTCKCGVFSVSGELLYKDEIPTRKDEGGSLILEDIKKRIGTGNPISTEGYVGSSRKSK